MIAKGLGYAKTLFGGLRWTATAQNLLGLVVLSIFPNNRLEGILMGSSRLWASSCTADAENYGEDPTARNTRWAYKSIVVGIGEVPVWYDRSRSMRRWKGLVSDLDFGQARYKSACCDRPVPWRCLLQLPTTLDTPIIARAGLPFAHRSYCYPSAGHTAFARQSFSASANVVCRNASPCGESKSMGAA
jgi:hypothetical protein